MIIAKQEPLPEAKETQLREWFAKPAFNTLKQLLADKCKIAVCPVVDDALLSMKFDTKIDTANKKLQEAQQYVIALEVIEKISQQKEKFTSVKLI